MPRRPASPTCRSTLNGVGTAKARNTVTVRPQVDGRILSLNFKEGQDVKRGDVLAKIDPATYQAQLDQAVAKKALDEVQLANARRDLERYAKLGGNVVAQKTIDTQRALVDQLIAQIKADDAAIANAKAYLDYTTIVSPLDGRTGIRMVDEGNLVRGVRLPASSSSPRCGRSPCSSRCRSSSWPRSTRRWPPVPSASRRSTPTARPSLDRGTLQVVDNQVDQTTGTVRMKAEFPNANLQLWPGQFVNVRVLIDTLKQVVVVPTPAVQRGPNGTFAYVVQADERVALRPITVALQNETQAVIAKGIDAAERVVTTGFARLKDGTRVDRCEPGRARSAATAAGSQAGACRKRARRCAPPAPPTCRSSAPASSAAGEAMRACLQANAAQLSEACKAAAAARSGGKPREADARKADGSSTQ